MSDSESLFRFPEKETWHADQNRVVDSNGEVVGVMDSVSAAIVCSASPDLLKACEKCEKWLTKVVEVVEAYTGTVPEALKEIRAAIIKAKGGS